MTLFDRVKESNFSSLSIIGLAKNVGKTTTLNYLIDEGSKSQKCTMGITSTGWDGEAFDSITSEPKPRIIVPKGCIVATTKECLIRSTLSYEILEETGMVTSLGEVVILRAEDRGRIEIAGPTSISELIKVRNRMRALGCSFIIFDGAINRKASASPEVCDAVIIATGMNAGYHLDDVKRHTSFWISCFSLQEWDGKQSLPETSKEAFIINETGNIVQRIPHSAIDSLENIHEKGYLFLPGAITDEIIEHMIKLKSQIPIIIHDSTKIFLSPHIASRWKKRGGQIILKKSTKIVGVTVNPTNISGKSCDALFFLETMAEICAPYPTWDIVLGKGMNL